MDKETNNQDNPSLLNPNNNNTNKEDQSPKKPYGGAGGNNDRLKRDEWSEGAVSSLLEAYESKWVLRNRAKLKGHDWEEVARYVSARANNTKSSKTQTQCKNKIESMKKRYRSESANADGSSWLLYPRLDLLLRGSSAAAAAAQQPPPPPPPPPPLQQQAQHVNSPLMLLEPEQSPAPPQQPPHLADDAAATPHQPQTGTTRNSHGSNGVDHRMAKEDGASDKKDMDTSSSTPAVYSEKEKLRSKKLKMKVERKKRQKREEWEIAESIRWLAEVVVRSEQARMDTMREIEKMRAEAEAKRGELDLKRTEIIANTQLEIAKLFAANYGKGVDSSLRIGRN